MLIKQHSYAIAQMNLIFKSKSKPIFSLIKSSIVEIQRLLLVLVWPLMHVCLLFFMVKWQSKQTKMTKNKEHRVPLPHVMTHISNSWIHHISANWLLHKLFSFQTICYQWKKLWRSTQFAAYQSLPGKYVRWAFPIHTAYKEHGDVIDGEILWCLHSHCKY